MEFITERIIETLKAGFTSHMAKINTAMLVSDTAAFGHPLTIFAPNSYYHGAFLSSIEPPVIGVWEGSGKDDSGPEVGYKSLYTKTYNILLAITGSESEETNRIISRYTALLRYIIRNNPTLQNTSSGDALTQGLIAISDEAPLIPVKDDLYRSVLIKVTYNMIYQIIYNKYGLY